MYRHTLGFLLVSIVALPVLTSCRSSGKYAGSNGPPAGFYALFDGADLAGWWGADTEDPRQYLALRPEELQKKHDASLDDIRQHWSAEGGELVNDGNGLFLTTDKNYGDFELLVDYKTVPLADSGIYLRGCPQVQIWDSTEKDKFSLGANKGSGGLWNNSPGAAGKDPLVKADKPFGEWNHFRIIMVGSRVWVWLNGKQTVNGAVLENYYTRKLPVPPRGPIQLQTHGGEIRWRNIFIREIGSDEANQRLSAIDPSGFKSVFNGKDFAGWEGPLDCCQITNAALAWQPKKGGTIYTKAEYTNFVVRLEFKLPPGGNNGLAIRYPGEGDAAYAGMCECQVLDDNYEKATGDKIDPRQVHGSAYGMVAALRGYQHPIGEWNYEEVTVIGPTIKVELNGTQILDADLSEVTTFMADHAHPGKDRASGHFGFAGHNDPVMFKSISIKPLN
jgi:3-keto-disaccharide hydrolase